MPYKILSDRTKQGLERLVNEEIVKGGSAQGGVQTDTNYFYQAVITDSMNTNMEGGSRRKSRRRKARNSRKA